MFSRFDEEQFEEIVKQNECLNHILGLSCYIIIFQLSFFYFWHEYLSVETAFYISHFVLLVFNVYAQ